MVRKLSGVAVALATVGTVLLSSPMHASAAPVLRPGSSITDGNGYCTLNWIYDGSGVAYGGAAAHCFTKGTRVSISDSSLGTALVEFGTVAYRSTSLDFELIQIDANCACAVSAAMAGHPDIPKGVSTVSSAKVGDTVQYSGHGVATDATVPTQQQRIGVLGYNDGAQHYSYGVVSPGDSGGPVADVTDGNKALGIVDTVGLALTPLPQVGEGGVSMTALLSDAAAHGFPVQVRTV